MQNWELEKDNQPLIKKVPLMEDLEVRQCDEPCSGNRTGCSA